MAKTILVVEDDDILRDFLNFCLRAKGYNSLIYANGATAINAIQEGINYDLALVDYILPDISGEKVAQESKRRNPSCPVIIASGLDADSIASGIADSFLAKPYDLNQLEAAINEQYRKPTS